MSASSVSLTAVPNFPLIQPGDDLAAQILHALEQADMTLQNGDVLVLAQNIVSKAEDRFVYLSEVEVSDQARTLAKQVDKDPALVELILQESKEVVRQRTGVVIVEHNQGYVQANAGIDRSNIEAGDSERGERVLLLPEDSDASAKALRLVLEEKLGIELNIIINDSAGRAWRQGIMGFTIGTSGFEALSSKIGSQDLFGRPLEVTEIAVADELAAAASFMMGQGNEGCPLVVIRGADLTRSEEGSKALIRPKEQDLFR